MNTLDLVQTKPDSQLTDDERQLLIDYECYRDDLRNAWAVHMEVADETEAKFDEVADTCLRLGLMKERVSPSYVTYHDLPF